MRHRRCLNQWATILLVRLDSRCTRVVVQINPVGGSIAMRKLSLALLMLAELSAILISVWLVVTSSADSWRHELFAASVFCWGVVILLSYAGYRGLLRRLHDAVLANEPGETIRYLFYLRYPLLCATALMAFPFVASSSMRRLLDSLFSVAEFDLFSITALALLNSWSIMVVMELVTMYGPQRFGGGKLQWRPTWLHALWFLRHWIFALPAVPIVLKATLRAENPWGAFAWATVGAVAAFLLLAFTAWQRERVVRAGTEPSTLLLNGSWFRRRWDEEADNEEAEDEERDVPPIVSAWLRFLGPGYFDHQRQVPLPGHLLALTLLLVLACIYVVIGVAFRPSGGWNNYFPALGYLLVVLLLAVWALPAASFFLDRWRIPVIPVLVIVMWAGYRATQTDHYYRTLPAPEERVDSLSPAEVLDAWLQTRPESRHRMTVVAISGGGIAASAWGIEVLTGLEAELGRTFTESLHAVCSASGGSVAALYYLDGFHAQRPRSATELDRIRRAASHSSLPALTWGVAYPDLWRLVMPPVMSPFDYQDRGWALQEAWRSHLQYPHLTLHSLRHLIRAGTMPAVLFDATIVETGRPFVLTPVDIHRVDGNRFTATQSFCAEYPSRDLDWVTAARLSATFPWVSPICRASPDSGGVGWHIADAAYFDNYGMVSLVEWLNTVLPRYARSVQRPKLLIIRITIRELKFTAPPNQNQNGWASTVYGPLITLLTAGASSQIARNEQLLESLLERWADRGEVEIVVVDFPLRIEVPLSWQLSPESIAQIRSRWADEVARGSQIQKIRCFYSD